MAWLDDKGISRVNRGYRYQYSSALGPFVVSVCCFLGRLGSCHVSLYPCIAVNEKKRMPLSKCPDRGSEVREAAVIATQQSAVFPCIEAKQHDRWLLGKCR